MKHRHLRLAFLLLVSPAACAGRRPPPQYVRAQPLSEEPPKPIVVAIPEAGAGSGAAETGRRTRRRRDPPHAGEADGPTPVGSRSGGQSEGHGGTRAGRLPERHHDLRLRPRRSLSDLHRAPAPHRPPAPARRAPGRQARRRRHDSLGPGPGRVGGRRQQNSSTSTSSRRARTSRQPSISTPTGARTSSSCTPTTTPTWRPSPGAIPRTRPRSWRPRLEQQQALARQRHTDRRQGRQAQLQLRREDRPVDGRRGYPTQVFDDGHKTFVRFPAAMLDREAPALFVLSSTGDTQLVNYRVKNDTYIVDRLFESAGAAPRAAGPRNRPDHPHPLAGGPPWTTSRNATCVLDGLRTLRPRWSPGNRRRAETRTALRKPRAERPQRPVGPDDPGAAQPNSECHIRLQLPPRLR